MQKLYACVDETGQDTEGELFLVAVVVLGENRDALRRNLSGIERSSGKHAKKWSRATPKQREAYLHGILDHPAFAGALYYSIYRHTRAYVDLTILSTAKAIHTHAPHPHDTTILVDGLKRSEQHRFATGLRRLKVNVRKVRGANHRKDVFIRLADAIAGSVRDSLGGDQRLRPLYTRAIRDKIIR